jgi:dihydroxyacetone kinase-like predicted kinase
LQAGLSALVAFNPSQPAAENAGEMEAALGTVATGAVTRASRAVQLNGHRVEPGEFLGLVEGKAFAGGRDFAEVARAVVDGLLAEPRSVLTFLTGDAEAELDGLVAELAGGNPELEIEVHEGGQPLYPLLISAE